MPSDAPAVRPGLVLRATLKWMEDPITEELRIRQERRESDERERAAEPGKEGEKHGRRAERASYLREKLEERADAERRAEEERGD